MRPGLIKTDNVMKGLAALQELKKACRDFSGRRFLVLEGATGRGKTVFSRWYAVHDVAAHWVEADPDYTPSWLMRDAAEALGLERKHSLESNKRGIAQAVRRDVEAGRVRLLVLDEADRLIKKSLLETVRGLHDVGLPLVLVGESGAWGKISRLSPRFADRVGQVIVFGDVSARDVAQAAAELADLALPPEVAEHLTKRVEGNFRRAAKVLEELERLCKAGPGEGGVDRRRVDQAVHNLRIAEKKAV